MTPFIRKDILLEAIYASVMKPPHSTPAAHADQIYVSVAMRNMN